MQVDLPYLYGWYGYLPGQEIHTRTQTCGKTRPKPAGIPVPVCMGTGIWPGQKFVPGPRPTRKPGQNPRVNPYPCRPLILGRMMRQKWSCMVLEASMVNGSTRRSMEMYKTHHLTFPGHSQARATWYKMYHWILVRYHHSGRVTWSPIRHTTCQGLGGRCQQARCLVTWRRTRRSVLGRSGRMERVVWRRTGPGMSGA
jgi:hypothetical protein